MSCKNEGHLKDITILMTEKLTRSSCKGIKSHVDIYSDFKLCGLSLIYVFDLSILYYLYVRF